MLLVDDESAILQSLSRLLARCGWTCESTEAPLVALGRLVDGAFDALVADLKMEALDGIELCRRARLGGFTGPLVLYSGYVTRDARLRALRAGAHAVVPKDADGEALAALLSSLCALRDSPASESAPKHPASQLVELLDLSRHEALLLSGLLDAPAPVPAHVLMERVWGRRGSRNLFDVTRRRLNRKLEGTGWTVRSAGSKIGYELARTGSTARA